MRSPLAAPPCQVEITGFGVFPSSGPPRVIWMGAGSGADGLVSLHAELAGRLTVLGDERERRAFHPHVTVARMKERASRRGAEALRRAVRDLEVGAGLSSVEAVTLFRSRLSQRGAACEAVVRVPLAG